MNEQIRIIKKKINELKEIDFKDEKDSYANSYAITQLEDIITKIKFMEELNTFRESVANDRQEQAEKE